ncbi:hypothetical protein K432DRAFT_377934 [Lepidopterella palustris CBS 459.81]|uniref:Uncharacterized protein n=1 Tax=Lepidopterella palustris CBS 459.81 TaxID=1314670 RepID=A0A8E2EJS1_9PEZI|nr:hypothetical protein K432DRAFT_377934 [Lepidopterella palustris CBS 459.81]
MTPAIDVPGTPSCLNCWYTFKTCLQNCNSVPSCLNTCNCQMCSNWNCHDECGFGSCKGCHMKDSPAAIRGHDDPVNTETSIAAIETLRPVTKLAGPPTCTDCQIN